MFVRWEPKDAAWMQFEVDCDGRIVTVTLKPKIWKKLTDASQAYPQWVASISGKMGDASKDGFTLLEPNVQTFEKKPKPVEVAS